MPSDPVHYDHKEKMWFFWDETWAYRQGPYTTESKAREMLDLYAKDVLK